jgi:integrase
MSTSQNHIIPAIGDMKLADVKPIHIQSIIDSLSKTHKPSTITTIRTIVHIIFESAVSCRLIEYNPVTPIHAPRNRRTAVRTLDNTELSRLITASKGTPFELSILVTIFTGLRKGEVCGLQWDDLNISTGTLLVCHSVSQISAEHIELKSTKSDKSRLIKLPSALLAVLKSVKAKRQAKGLMSEWICCRNDGSMMTPNALSSGYCRVVKKAGIKNTSIHKLRHTHATVLMDAGVPLKVISERLGHASINTTASIYLHVTQHMQDVAADVLDDKLGGL